LDRTPDAAKKLLQFCHGAPGFVICLSDLVTAEIDDLLLAAGETIWSAGPVRKGANLCHGTAGNGYAFLKLYQRTKDARWLQRARAFAMHAIGQAEIEARRHGQLRYSLWTGDLGLAVYLWDCIVGQARFPTLDVFYASRAKA
jgi:lantibiotic modifying enzyme